MLLFVLTYCDNLCTFIRSGVLVMTRLYPWVATQVGKRLKSFRMQVQILSHGLAARSHTSSV